MNRKNKFCGYARLFTLAYKFLFSPVLMHEKRFDLFQNFDAFSEKMQMFAKLSGLNRVKRIYNVKAGNFIHRD